MGPAIFTKVLFVVALLFCTIEILATLFTILYQRYIYDRYLRPRYDEGFNPRCSIVVPCKGIPKDLGKNLRGFLELDYNNYEVIFVAESDHDSAVDVIQQICADNDNASLVVAGLSDKCAQKNHNMLAALDSANDPEIYVFADSDIKPAPNWLKELILPLSDEKVTVTSGFRWLQALKANAGELTHFYVNTFIYVTFTVACFFGGVGLWGGSMAIRKKDFQLLGVAKKWSKAAVDDMSLSHLVYKNSKKAVIVPYCLTQTDDLLQGVGATISWFERQIMFLKAYQRPLWYVSLPLAIIGLIFLFLVPIALIGALLFENHTFLSLGGAAALLFLTGEAITGTLYPLLGKTPPLVKFLLFQPLLRLTHIASYFKTVVTNSIYWAGITYHLSRDGDVDTLERQIEKL